MEENLQNDFDRFNITSDDIPVDVTSLYDPNTAHLAINVDGHIIDISSPSTDTRDYDHMTASFSDASGLPGVFEPEDSNKCKANSTITIKAAYSSQNPKFYSGYIVLPVLTSSYQAHGGYIGDTYIQNTIVDRNIYPSDLITGEHFSVNFGKYFMGDGNTPWALFINFTDFSFVDGFNIQLNIPIEFITRAYTVQPTSTLISEFLYSDSKFIIDNIFWNMAGYSPISFIYNSTVDKHISQTLNNNDRLANILQQLNYIHANTGSMEGNVRDLLEEAVQIANELYYQTSLLTIIGDNSEYNSRIYQVLNDVRGTIVEIRDTLEIFKDISEEAFEEILEELKDILEKDFTDDINQWNIQITDIDDYQDFEDNILDYWLTDWDYKLEVWQNSVDLEPFQFGLNYIIQWLEIVWEAMGNLQIVCIVSMSLGCIATILGFINKNR